MFGKHVYGATVISHWSLVIGRTFNDLRFESLMSDASVVMVTLFIGRGNTWVDIRHHLRRSAPNRPRRNGGGGGDGGGGDGGGEDGGKVLPEELFDQQIIFPQRRDLSSPQPYKADAIQQCVSDI